MKLSILVCTVFSRVDGFLPKIIKQIEPQLTDEVEVLYLGDNKRRTVGEKRNDLLTIAQGEYVAFVDDDDRITDDYVKKLLEGIETGADIVNFMVACSVNGGEYKPVYYDARFKKDRNLSDRYLRLPNHLMCVKRKIALGNMFPMVSFGEDAAYAEKLRGKIKTQAFIEKVLYYYDFNNKTSETQ